MTMENNNNMMQEMLDQNESFFKVPRRGQIVMGKVIQVLDNEVVVNIGYKSDGIISKNEITNNPDINLNEILKEGDQIEVFILKEDDGEGNVLLSKKRVDIRKDWEELEDVVQNGKNIEINTGEAVKGGVIAYYNEIRGFIPASHLSNRYVSDLSEFANKTLEVKVIEIDKKSNRVIFSHKEIREEALNKKKKQLWSTLEKDTIIEGVVKRITNFGAFVDIGGVDGLIHISELSWGRVKHPSDVLKIGDKVEVYVKDLDKENEKISLSLRNTKENPWEKIEDNYKIGDIVEGTVVKLVDFGAFIELEPGVQGLVHISQISDKHISKPSDALKVGNGVSVKIVDLNKEEQRISLSIKEAESTSEVEEYKNSDDDQSVTIGDLVDLKDLNK